MTVRELLVKIGFDLDKAKVKRAEDAIEGIKSGMEGLAGMAMQVAAAVGVALGVQEVMQTADAWNSVEARVGLATKSMEQQKQVLNEIYKISNSTRQSYTATADLYSKVARSADSLKMTQDDVLSMTDVINKALVVGGGNAQQNEAAILQLGQALSAGKLQGDELGSLLENAPRLTQAIADSLGVSVGALKKMGAEGELTSKKVAEALMKQSKVIEAEFKKMPLTIGQAMQLAQNKFGKLISDFGKGTQIFDKAAKAITAFANEAVWAIESVVGCLGGWENALYLVASALTAVGVAIAAMNIPAFVAAMATLLANPATWMFLGIAAAVMVVALALQDLYVWIKGGDSLIGDYLGSWRDFYKEHQATIDGFINFFKSAWAFIKALFSGDTDEMGKRFGDMFGTDMIGIFESFVDAFKTGWQILKSFFDMIVESFKNGWQFWTSIFNGDWEGAMNAVKDQIKNLYTHFVDIFALLSGFLGRTLDRMVEYVRSKFGDGVANIFAGLVEMLKATWQFFLSLFKGDLEGALEAAKKLFQGFWDFIVATLAWVWDLIKAAAKSFLEMIIQAAGRMVALLGEKIDACINAIKEKFRSGLEAVKSFFAGLRDYVMGILQDISGGIGTFIVDKIQQGLGMLSKLAGVNLGGLVTPGQAVGNSTRTNYLTVDNSPTYHVGSTKEVKQLEGNGLNLDGLSRIFEGYLN